MESNHSMLTDEYKKHNIFNDLNKYIKFYDLLAFNVLKFINKGTQALNYETYLVSSIRSTLESVKKLLEFGTINDAYSLTRKYYDSIVIHCYTSLYIKDNFSLENFIVEKVNNWLRGKEKLPQYREMSEYVRKHKDLNDINDLLSKSNYKNVRGTLNDHTHYNYFQFMMLNDYQLNLDNRIKSLDLLQECIREIFIKHFVWMFSINESLMASDDHIDYLDFGETPPENSQYWVANFIQEAFDEIIKKYRLDLAKELIKNTCMELK
ncbi:hypothetical protein [Francisella opportunistica]|nr:hypothetical protein [Francisella opportunistica]